MRLELASTRRAALLAACSSLLAPSPAPAADDFAPPTYSLKGLASAITGADKPPPADLGVIGRGTNNQLSGRLNSCGDKKGCISSFNQADEPNYVPPWTYNSEFTIQATSSFDARKEQLKAQARAEAAAAAASAAGDDASSAAAPAAAAPAAAPKGKSIDDAFGELKTAVEAAGGSVQKAADRYLLAEFTDSSTGQIDDVEFLFSLDNPIVGYRSAPRAGSDDKRQRNRIRDIRKSLAPQGWKSVGRINMEG